MHRGLLPLAGTAGAARGDVTDERDPGAARWHAIPAERVLAALRTSRDGLPSTDARRRLAAVGPNVLPRARSAGVLELIVHQIKSPIVYVLLGAAGVALALGKGTDAAVVAGVVVVNTIIGFFQEHRAGKAIHALAAFVPETVTVLRDGVRAVCPAADLVPGDVVVLGAGDKVPADLRVVAAEDLRVEEAALTGESTPVSKQVDPVEEEAALGDRKDMAYGGTLVAAGTGAGVVVSTGAKTELGRIDALLRSTEEMETPLTRSLAGVGRGVTIVIGVVAAAIAAVAHLRGYEPVDALLSGISLAVAALPEGLPAIITITLSIGVQRMARRRAVVRRLPAVEALGSTSVICSDKTGTLTRNEMTVQALWTPAGEYALSGVGYAPEGRLSRGGEAVPAAPDDVRELAGAAALCSDATVRREGAGWAVTGDPTEGALVVAAGKVGLHADDLRADWPREGAIPFDARRRYMATLHRDTAGRQLVVVKGAPEVVVDRCASVASGRPIDRQAVLREVDRLAARGMRVLAVAVREPAPVVAALAPDDAFAGAALLGLIGMMDPPRPEAVEAVGACRKAGIAVKMITGDHRATAAAIGRELGLLAEGGAALTGAEIGHLSDQDLRDAAVRHEVFARVSPEHKLRLVKALQGAGQVVAMTGDGVNDAPALKQADVGVAMGVTGTAAAKEAADIVLTDDDFATIYAAVEEGRRVYDNLVKALAFILPTNIGQALTILIATVAFPIVDGTPLLPILPLQILWVNLVTSVALSLPLAFEAKEPDLMERPPRARGEPILGAFVLLRTVLIGALMAAGTVGLFLVDYLREVEAHAPGGLALRESQTIAVNTLVLFQVFYLLTCRTLRGPLMEIGPRQNLLVYAGIAGLLLLQAAFVYLPFMHGLFDSAPLPATEWARSAAVAAMALPVMGLARMLEERARGGPGQVEGSSQRSR